MDFKKEYWMLVERVPSMPGNRASRHCLSLIQSLLLDVSPDTEFLAELADNLRSFIGSVCSTTTILKRCIKSFGQLYPVAYLRVELNRLTPELIELLLADNVSGYNDQGRE